MKSDIFSYVHHSNLIEGIDDSQEDLRSLRAWKWLVKQPHITQSILLNLHRKITSSQLSADQAGQYRKVDVRVGNYYPPAALSAQAQIYGWLVDLDEGWSRLDPKKMHIRFEKIHPFIDGNGRTGRMLMWWHELKLGRTPSLILQSGREHYYGWFK
jgi:Fic family protein